MNTNICGDYKSKPFVTSQMYTLYTCFLQRPWGGSTVWRRRLPRQQAVWLRLAQLLSTDESGPLEVWREDRGPQDCQQVRSLFEKQCSIQSKGILKKSKTITVKFYCSFLCLVPDEAKSSYHVEGTGYDTYLRDAHRQVRLMLQVVKGLRNFRRRAAETK